MDLDLIKQEIENWIFNYLDIPSAFYMNNKPCPFAAKAWRGEQVNVLLGDKSTVRQEVYKWDDSYQLVIIVFDLDDWSNANSWAERYNERIEDKDLYVMVFEPGDEEPDDPELDPEKYGQVVDYEYGMVLIQRREELNKFSKFLESQNYYENCSDDFMQYVNKRRSQS
jgi:hypothetical protein